MIPALFLTLAACSSAAANATHPEPGRYADVDGVHLYYEVHGAGRPVILLHGGFGTIDHDWGALIPALAAHYQVIAVELQAHGRTADIDRPLRYESLADDIDALISQQKLDHPDVIGYSLGGGVALQLAIHHPGSIGKIALVSTAAKRDGWIAPVRDGMSQMNAAAMVATPMHAAYAQLAPRPDDWPRLVDKLRTLLSTDYDWTPELAQIHAPTLLVYGDHDFVDLHHALELAGAIHDAELAILPGTSHLDITAKTDLLVPTLTSFLN
jgi:pimeloyl-ACP methyl ester carboxylesterase